MFHRLLCAVTASVFLGTPSLVLVDPITYDFTGTLAGSAPGTNQISGSFTINADPVVLANFQPPDYQANGLYGAQESGSDVSVTVQVGGHVINFSNTAQNPDAAQSTIQQLGNPQATVPEPLFDYARLSGFGAGGNYFFSFANSADTLFSNAVAGQPIDVRNFNSADVSSAEIGFSSLAGNLLISSIQPAAVPEPSMFVVFAAVGIATIACARSRHASGVSIIRWSRSATRGATSRANSGRQGPRGLG